jgi:tRNA nucleotidyltransferase (CCA-adding enzyme)
VTILELLESLDAFRRGNRVTEFLDACEADARGRTGLEEQPYPQRDLVLSAWQAALAVDTRAVTAPGGAGDGLSGEALGAAIRNARLAAVVAAR